MKPWEIVSEDQVVDLRIFTLHRQVLRHPVHRTTSPFFVMRTVDWVNIVAVDDDGGVVLVRQPRAGTASVTVEIPGGMIDPGESALQAAQRELREETGYEARQWTRLGVVHPNPAIMNNECTTFLAQGARRVAEQNLDAGEQIEVMLRPLSEVDALIDSGEISHALVVAAFAHLARHAARNE